MKKNILHRISPISRFLLSMSLGFCAIPLEVDFLPKAIAAPATQASATQTPVSEEAKSFISNIGDQAVTILTDASLNNKQKKEKFSTILSNNFAVNEIARFVAGKHFRQMDASQKAKYNDLFKELIVEIYTLRFNEYPDARIKVGNTRTDKQAIVVRSKAAIPNKEPLEIDWKLYKQNNKYKIYDVYVNGISMSMTQRSEFAGIIADKRGKVDAFLNELEERVKKLQDSFK